MEDILPYLRLVHGAFNAGMILLIFYQGRLGLAIRRARRLKKAFPLARVKRHRKIGSKLRILILFGFLFGLILALVNERSFLVYPLHFFVGLTIVLLLFTTYLVSRKIKGPDSLFRTPHFILGLCILLLSAIQLVLGLGILL
jgi:hypothetical protein